MQVGDLVWARWEMSSMGIIIKVDFDDNVGYPYYRIRWFFANDRTHETVEFEDDLLTKEQKCKLEH